MRERRRRQPDNQLTPLLSPSLPALVAAVSGRASMRFLEFFAANIRSPHPPPI
jgi:hypothetical protein